MWQTDFFLILDHLLPFYPPPLNNPENQNFEKMKKALVDIILHKCSIPDNHRIYGSWDMKCNKQNFFVILGHFCPFTSLTAQKMKISKKWTEEIIILHKCTESHDHRLYCSWDMACEGCNCYFSFWAIFFNFTLLTAQKMKISKKWKLHLEISSFNTSVPKIVIICFTVPEIRHVTNVIVIFHFGLFFALLPPSSPKNENFKKWKKLLEITSFYTSAP